MCLTLHGERKDSLNLVEVAELAKILQPVERAERVEVVELAEHLGPVELAVLVEVLE